MVDGAVSSERRICSDSNENFFTRCVKLQDNRHECGWAEMIAESRRAIAHTVRNANMKDTSCLEETVPNAIGFIKRRAASDVDNFNEALRTATAEVDPVAVNLLIKHWVPTCCFRREIS